MSIKIQEAKSHIKPIDTSKLTTEHFIALREKRSSSNNQNTNASFPNQETLTSTRPTPPTGSNLHNKEKPQTFSIQKDHLKHSNLNNMKRQKIFSR